MKNHFKYLLYISFILIHFSCAAEKEAMRIGVEKSQLTIKHLPGMNVVGRVTVDGNARPGVVVSDGVNVVLTDDKGEYQMRSTNRQHVFVSIPEDCEIPIHNGMPKIYKTLQFEDDAVIQVDFELKKQPKASSFKLLTLADVQIGDERDIEMLSQDIMDNITRHAQSLEGYVIGISLGDLVWNTPQLYGDYIAQINRTGVPTFSVIGNHDHNEKVKNDIESDKEFRDAFGPTYYSCNIGDWHLVVLDDVLYRGVNGRNDYSGSITQQQLEWLKKDLSHVDKNKSILVGLHIPTSRRNSTTQVDNNQALYDLLKDFHRVEILSGHTHNNFSTSIAPNMKETTLGAVMGAYWNGIICNDGSPRGYAVLSFNGNEIEDQYYIGSDSTRNYQIKIYLPHEATYRWGRIEETLSTPNDAKPLFVDNEHLLINVFCWHTDWKVEIKEDDAEWSTLSENIKTLDPEAVKTLQYGNAWEKRPSAEPEQNNDHMFVYKPSQAAWNTITVRATDPFGNVYTSTVNNQ